MTKLKHIRFNKTNRKNRTINSTFKIKQMFFNSYLQQNKTKRKYLYPLLPLTRKNNYTIIKPQLNKRENYEPDLTRKNKIIMPKFVSNFTIKRRLTQPKLTDSDTNNINNNNINNNNINENININKRTLFQNYIRSKLLTHKKNNYLNQFNSSNVNKENKLNNTNIENKTPIYNSYVPGSGIGASNIVTRRLKNKFAYLR